LAAGRQNQPKAARHKRGHPYAKNSHQNAFQVHSAVKRNAGRSSPPRASQKRRRAWHGAHFTFLGSPPNLNLNRNLNLCRLSPKWFEIKIKIKIKIKTAQPKK
jgi:hypothetical protein